MKLLFRAPFVHFIFISYKIIEKASLLAFKIKVIVRFIKREKERACKRKMNSDAEKKKIKVYQSFVGILALSSEED